MRIKGFSLLELIITIVLIAVLSVSTLISVSNLKAKNEQQVIIDELKSVIQYAKIQSLNLGHSVSLEALDPSLNWSKGAVLFLTHTHMKLHEWNWSHPSWVTTWSGLNHSQQIIISNALAHSMSNGTFFLEHKFTKKHTSLILNRLGRLRVAEMNGGQNNSV